MRRLLVLSLLAAPALGCAPSIGDSCGNRLDCSINGDRECDSTRPGGACTVLGCEADTCPDDAVCVRFRPEPSRLTFTACMRVCQDDGNCRFDDGYRCVSPPGVTCSADPNSNEPNCLDGALDPGTGEPLDPDPVCQGGTCALAAGAPLAEVVDVERGQRSFCVATEPPMDDED